MVFKRQFINSNFKLVLKLIKLYKKSIFARTDYMRENEYILN